MLLQNRFVNKINGLMIRTLMREPVMDSSLQQSSVGQKSFGPELFAPASGKISGMYQGGRSRNFRIAQGLQFVATKRRVSLQPGALFAGETDAVSVSATSATEHSGAAVLPSLATVDG